MSNIKNNCESCKFWGLDANEEACLGIVKTCSRVKLFWDCTKWNEDFDRVLSEGHERDLAFVQDASDYSASLLTRSTFYCNQYEAGSTVQS